MKKVAHSATSLSHLPAEINWALGTTSLAVAFSLIEQQDCHNVVTSLSLLDSYEQA